MPARVANPVKLKMISVGTLQFIPSSWHILGRSDQAEIEEWDNGITPSSVWHGEVVTNDGNDDNGRRH